MTVTRQAVKIQSEKCQFLKVHVIQQVCPPVPPLLWLAPVSHHVFCSMGTVSVTSSVVLYMVSQKECARLWESVPYVKVYRYNPEHLYPKLNG